MVSAICLLVFWSDLANSILVEVRSLIELNSKQPYVKSKLRGSVGHMLNQSIQDTHGAEGASITIGGMLPKDLNKTPRCVQEVVTTWHPKNYLLLSYTDSSHDIIDFK
jgi:hypothetical protein